MLDAAGPRAVIIGCTPPCCAALCGACLPLRRFNCKGEARELCDGHKAYLLRKALRTFNGSGKVHK